MVIANLYLPSKIKVACPFHKMVEKWTQFSHVFGLLFVEAFNKTELESRKTGL
jgi:hypothetical protein